ncbi:hypothetical protein SBA5_230003 [Candidatus Sulfotelmatomonas gaucii]|uniref:Uncharacterized protein n=1 Tax=Candidatus Sulfuritelmatomonas gaucii TaxID=2043161 RepID=A0A2N9L8X7_9BACT|nr:hypothetical protein SBA5_230003 [Candidatus Sulfotelmatomonas gaucii]
MRTYRCVALTDAVGHFQTHALQQNALTEALSSVRWHSTAIRCRYPGAKVACEGAVQ